ncbi:MAG: alpha/beta hydrolase fold domain-containing protein [Planctomycetaceae bacterium]|jgi:acetyl esterase/lipase|nr:alpha/beta hydrolase fold domain-containing protein [Planctomycetaceae bacterium]MBT4011089.1 alpha/beta hydrolase fold domain-containing protein [Planctomycetaceae bacterium]MBT4725590.1 alpha/beta hydrolase fold domain-containing protein [Planctomycetaceae bacterium]MBT5125740.1 alpha/beta hydrolase fold domain-containing protein [Planctomycetaceae bacterium]MBT5599565.1 alpha/beta hydrolase fold domain-containing protein [Planctomycetaceae bacterium]
MPLIIALVLCSLIAADVVAAPSRAFLRLDKNNDGQLSAAELSNAPTGLIKAIDGNGDGVITAREDERYFSSRNRPQQIDRIATKKSTHSYANNDNPRQTVDVYQPLSRKSTKLPLLIFIHGGGWRSGSKDSGARQLSDYVRSGNYVGASIGYRLSGEAQWPAQIHDCKAAIRYLKANATTFGIDAEKVAVFGTSAGGHLSCMVTVSGNTPELEGKIGRHLKQSSAVTCGISYFGPTNFLRMNDYPGRMDHDAANSPESLLIGKPIQLAKSATQKANPESYVDKDDPPMLFIHGTDDPLVAYNQSVILSNRLKPLGVSGEIITVQGGGHGGFKNPKIKELERLFFELHLHGARHEIKSQTVPN